MSFWYIIVKIPIREDEKMKHLSSRYDRTIKCDCGNEVPIRWAFEGKMWLRTEDVQGKRKIEKYCVQCATEDEYQKLVTRFSEYMHTN